MVQLSSGQTYVLLNKKSGTVCDLSGANQESVIGFINKRSLNQKVCFPLVPLEGLPRSPREVEDSTGRRRLDYPERLQPKVPRRHWFLARWD